MRIRILFYITLVSIFFTSDIANVRAAQDTEKLASNQVIAYYFHGNFRCANCYNIEQFAKEAIHQNFKNELASGKLSFKIINIEGRGNEHFVNDYRLYTKSLVLSLVKNGEEVDSKNLTRIWEYLRNKARFQQYVKDEITDYLNRL
ncbi:MAG: hypothetical protein JSV93_01505 [Candidatus Omnitrophota bacterium]|nr:MAG: hypothetical protein JSV93_01505 [Candidatus Omnitrophota bacterium]